MQRAELLQAAQDELDAAGREQVRRDVLAARLEIAQQRRGLADLVEVVDRQLDAGLLRDREEVQHRVGRAARGCDSGHRVVDRVLGDQLARVDAALEQVDHQLAGLNGDFRL